MEKQIKGYSAIFDEMNGSFTFICSAETREKCEEKAYKEYDNERVRIIPYYDSPFEVL